MPSVHFEFGAKPLDAYLLGEGEDGLQYLYEHSVIVLISFSSRYRHHAQRV
jgi:hypothetical protein